MKWWKIKGTLHVKYTTYTVKTPTPGSPSLCLLIHSPPSSLCLSSVCLASDKPLECRLVETASANSLCYQANRIVFSSAHAEDGIFGHRRKRLGSLLKNNFKEDKLHFSPLLSFPVSSSVLLLPPSSASSFSCNLLTFLGLGSNIAFHWEIHLDFWLFQGVFGPMSLRARQHLFSWIPNGCVLPESNACSERCSHCYYHHAYLATSFSLGSFSLLSPRREQLD